MKWLISLPPDDPRVPLHLLLFAGQTGMSTITCVADYMSWQAVSSQEKMALGQLYLPYLMLGESRTSSFECSGSPGETISAREAKGVDKMQLSSWASICM